MRAAAFLGLNCGFGPSDIYKLPKSVIDLEEKVIKWPRVKTEADRVCPLWKETIDAIELWDHCRTKDGKRFFEFDRADTVSRQFHDSVKLAGRKRNGLSFYSLRHTLATVGRGAHDDDVYGKQMAPMAATLANDAIMENVIAYIGTLPDTPSPATVDGDAAHGAKLYEVCAYCHGADGAGIQAINAPRQAGMSDWYLVRQLENFKQGVRGNHPEDLNGKQMGFMSRTLQDDQAIRDVVAYINTL